MIKPDAKRIEEILNSSMRYEIPKYQREYEWGKTEVTEFIEDLKGHSGDLSDSLFLGTLIFDVSKENEKKIIVVDGQQRLTTIYILLIACRNLAKKINENGIATLIQQKIAFTDSTTGESQGSRLISSESIRDIFDIMSDLNWDGDFPLKVKSSPSARQQKNIKRQVNKVKPIYDFFFEAAKDFNKNQLSGFLSAVYNSYVVRIDIQDSLEAFSIFERTNARGVDLEASDLLKNYLFSQGAENLEDAWSRIVGNSDGTLLRMLKYFYVSKRGHVTKSRLYKELKGYGREIGVNQLVQELEDFSQFYNTIRNTTNDKDIQEYFGTIGCTAIAGDESKYKHIFFALEGLRSFKIAQIYPLMYSALCCFVRNKNGDDSHKSKQLLQFFDVLEKYHFINTAICGRIGNEIEKLYADFCKKYDTSEDFLQTSAEFNKELRGRLASEEEFSSKFVDITYSQQSIPLIAYIFDRINNFGKIPGQRASIFNSDMKVFRKLYNVEHFYPQKLAANENDTPIISDAIHNIGNLLVISFKTNSQLSNASPERKMEMLKGELNNGVINLAYVNDFIKKYEDKASHWNEDIIKQRAIDLAKDSYRKVWKIN